MGAIEENKNLYALQMDSSFWYTAKKVQDTMNRTNLRDEQTRKAYLRFYFRVFPQRQQLLRFYDHDIDLPQIFLSMSWIYGNILEERLKTGTYS